MARIRSIKPEIVMDATLAKVSLQARLVFIYLITQADDEGLVLAPKRQLLGALFPHDEDISTACLETWLAELEALKRIRFRVTVDGTRVIELVNWHTHQKIINPSRRPILSPLLVPVDIESKETLFRLSIEPKDGIRTKDRDKDQGSRIRIKEKDQGEQADGPTPEGIVLAWNTFATAHGFPLCRNVNKGRERALHARVREPAFQAAFHEALAFLAASDWHRQNPITLDTFLRPGKAEGYAEKLPTIRAKIGTSRGNARAHVDTALSASLADGTTGRKRVQNGERAWEDES